MMLSLTIEQYISQKIIKEVIEPTGASLLVLGDWQRSYVDGYESRSQVVGYVQPDGSWNPSSFTSSEHFGLRDVMESISLARGVDGTMPWAHAGGGVVHYLSLFNLFCSISLPLSGNAMPDGTTCDSNIPGTDVFAFEDEESGHLNVAGALYAWPFLCDALSSVDLLPKDDNIPVTSAPVANGLPFPSPAPYLEPAPPPVPSPVPSPSPSYMSERNRLQSGRKRETRGQRMLIA